MLALQAMAGVYCSLVCSLAHIYQAKSSAQLHDVSHCRAGGAALELDARKLQAEVWQQRQLLADLRGLQGWTPAGRLIGNGDDLSVHRRHPKGAPASPCLCFWSCRWPKRPLFMLLSTCRRFLCISYAQLSILWRAAMAGSSIHSFRFEAAFDCGVDQLFAVAREFDLMSSWNKCVGRLSASGPVNPPRPRLACKGSAQS